MAHCIAAMLNGSETIPRSWNGLAMKALYHNRVATALVAVGIAATLMK